MPLRKGSSVCSSATAFIVAGMRRDARQKASNTGASDVFGEAVSLSADGDTLAVGASEEDSNATGVNGNQEDNSASSAGAVYLY